MPFRIETYAHWPQVIPDSAFVLPAVEWIAMAPYQNGWSGSAEYAIDALGFVHFRGQISKAGDVDSVFFILPLGFRPQVQTALSGVFKEVSEIDVPWQDVIIVTASSINGNVAITNINSTEMNTTVIALDGINFFAGLP